MATPLPTSLGPSELVGTYADGSEEWHAQRATGIGGSDIAAVAQVPGAFTSRYMLWLQKHGDVLPEEPSPFLRRLFRAGHVLEPEVAAEFTYCHPEFDVVETGSWRRSDLPWALSNPDRLLVDETGKISLLEIKNSGRGAGFENGFPPDKYVAQVRWYAGNLGLETSYLALMVGLADYSEWLIPTDHRQPIVNLMSGEKDWCMHVDYDNMLRSAGEFVQSLIDNNPPPLDAGADTYTYVRGRHPQIDPDLAVEIPRQLAVYLHQANHMAKYWDDQLRATKSEVLSHMGEAKAAYVDDVKVAYRQATGRSTPTLYLARSQAVRDLVGEQLVAA